MTGSPSNIKIKKPGKTTAFFICLLVAAFLWIVRALNTTYNYTLKIPVEFRNVPQNKKPLQNLPERLSIDIKASGLKVILILASKPFAPLVIDFNDLKSVNKQLSYVLSSGAIKLRPSTRFDAQITHVSPDTLYFTQKSGYHKVVPVKPVLTIKCAPGYAHNAPEFSPSFISITGDSNSIKTIDTLYTQNYQVNNVSASFQRQLEIIKPSTEIFLDNTRIDLKVQVDRLSEKIISIPIEVNANAIEYKSIHLYPSKVEVKYTTLQSSQQEIVPSMFKAGIDLKSAGKSSRAPVVLTTVPGGVNIISINPAEVEFLIIKK